MCPSGATCRGVRAALMLLAAQRRTADPAWFRSAPQWNGAIGKNGSQWKYFDEVNAASAKYSGRWRAFLPNIGETKWGTVDCPVQHQHFFSGGVANERQDMLSNSQVAKVTIRSLGLRTRVGGLVWRSPRLAAAHFSPSSVFLVEAVFKVTSQMFSNLCLSPTKFFLILVESPPWILLALSQKVCC